MERAPLRPVPSRPAGPIAPAEAVRYVTGELPGLDEPAAAALALVALVGRARQEIAEIPEGPALADADLADALFRARKALRRKLHPLPGSGWCERAERLISDRIDEALEHPGPARLEVHLANCTRCVEHERRLGQAHEALVAGFEGAHAPPPPHEPEPEAPATPDVPPGEAARPPAVLRAVEAPALPAPSSEPDRLPPAEEPAQALPAAEEPAQIVDEPQIDKPSPAAPLAQQPPASPLGTPAPPPAPRPLAPTASAPTVPTTPPQSPPADPPPTPPSAAPWPVASPSPQGWRSDAPRPVLAARVALETENEWGAIGALVAVLGVAVVVGLLAVLLASGG